MPNGYYWIKYGQLTDYFAYYSNFKEYFRIFYNSMCSRIKLYMIHNSCIHLRQWICNTLEEDKMIRGIYLNLQLQVLINEVPVWKHLRRRFISIYSRRRFLQISDGKQTDFLVRKISSEVVKASFNIFPYVTLCTLDIIYRKSFE